MDSIEATENVDEQDDTGIIEVDHPNMTNGEKQCADVDENIPNGSKEGDSVTETQSAFASPMLPVKFNKPPSTNPENKAIASRDSAPVISSQLKKDNISVSSTAVSGITKESPKIELPYREPPWSGIPEQVYSLEVIKDGVPKGTFELSGKSFFTFGRLDECDVTIEHPSCSRYHAVIQFCNEESPSRKKGFYLYDVGSSHGTILNKEKVASRVFCRLRVGYVIKFGASSRLWIMQGPPEDQEEELDITAIRNQQEAQRLAIAREVAAANQMPTVNQKRPEIDSNSEEDGISWGMREDAVEEQLNLQELLDKKKNIEVKDPKKTVKNFFESEGLEFDYEMEEKTSGRSLCHVARLRLPIETATSDEVMAEGTGPNKKEAILSCANEACRLIHAYDDILRRSREDQNVKRQRELEANDFYDSDDDTYLDRTGSVEQKRLKRMKHAGKKTGQEEVMTHNALKEKLFIVENEIIALKEKLRLSDESTCGTNDDAGDSLDAFMSSMGGTLDKKQKNSIKAQLIKLKKEAGRMSKLVEKTKPALPAIEKSLKSYGNVQTKQKLPPKRLKAEDAVDNNEGSVEESHSEYRSSAKETNISSSPTYVAITTSFSSTDPVISNEVSTAAAEEEESKKSKLEDFQKPDETVHTSKKKRVLGPTVPVTLDTGSPEPMKTEVSNRSADPKYSSWVPPKDQTGDGKTYLNEKYGY